MTKLFRGSPPCRPLFRLAFLMVITSALAACCGGGCGGGSSQKSHYTESYQSVSGVTCYYNKNANANVRTVAVTPFTAPTELIGASVSDMVVTELLRLGRYRIVERSQISRVLGETELALAGVSNAKAMEVGQMTGADAVIVGSVSEYEMAAYKGRKYPTVGLSLRCIDSHNGEIIWSSDYTERADDRNVALSEQARKVVHAISSTLYKKGLKGSVSR